MSINESDIVSRIGEKLFLKPEKADVCFVIESTSKRIPAHKILLSSNSDVFEAMFYGSLKEEGDIEIVDASAEAFEEFLQFFYFNANEIKLSIGNVSEVMYLGQKYDVKHCHSRCANFLISKISVENVIFSLHLAIIYDQIQLQISCESEILFQSKAVLQSTGFLDCDRRVLNHILNMSCLSCPETEVFEACMSWVRANSQQENLTRDIVHTHLGESFYEIRFSSMSLDEFVKLLPAYGRLFTADEYNEVLQVISQIETQPKMFRGCRRLLLWDENNVIRCNRFLGILERGMMYKIQSEEMITFSTNTALSLRYFVCAPIRELPAHAPANITQIRATILANSDETQSHFTFDYVHDIQGVTVKLPNPVVIKRGIMYQIRLLFPSNNYTACQELKPTVNIEPDIVVQFYNYRKVNEKIFGLIFELGFAKMSTNLMSTT